MSLSVQAIDTFYNVLAKHQKYGPETEKRCKEYAGRLDCDIAQVKTDFLTSFFQKKWAKSYMPSLIADLPHNDQEALLFLLDIEKPFAKASAKVLFRACCATKDAAFITKIFDKTLEKKEPKAVSAAFKIFPKDILVEKVKQIVILPAGRISVAKELVDCIGEFAGKKFEKAWEIFTKVYGAYNDLHSQLNVEVLCTAFSVSKNENVDAPELFEELEELARAEKPAEVFPHLTKEFKAEFPYAFAAVLAKLRFLAKEKQPIDDTIKAFREETKRLPVDVRNGIKVILRIDELFTKILSSWK